MILFLEDPFLLDGGSENTGEFKAFGSHYYNLLETLVRSWFRDSFIDPSLFYRCLVLYALLLHFILTNVLVFPFNRYGNGQGMWLPQSPVVKRMVGAGLAVQSVVVPGLGGAPAWES